MREALIEYQVRCLRMDKVKIPIIGGLLSMMHKRLGYLPRFHLATARVGEGQGAVVAERWTYRGNDLHAAYNTRQVFRADYPHGVHTVTTPADYSPPAGLFARLRAWARARAAQRPAPAPKARLPVVAAIARALPPHERIRHVQRLDRLGLLSA